MIYIFIFLAGTFSGMILIGLISANNIKELEEALHTQIRLRKNRDKLIERQQVDISKYRKIKNVIELSEEINEFAVITLNEIKEVINDRKSTNNF